MTPFQLLSWRIMKHVQDMLWVEGISSGSDDSHKKTLQQRFLRRPLSWNRLFRQLQDIADSSGVRHQHSNPSLKGLVRPIRHLRKQGSKGLQHDLNEHRQGARRIPIQRRLLSWRMSSSLCLCSEFDFELVENVEVVLEKACNTELTSAFECRNRIGCLESVDLATTSIVLSAAVPNLIGHTASITKLL